MNLRHQHTHTHTLSTTSNKMMDEKLENGDGVEKSDHTVIISLSCSGAGAAVICHSRRRMYVRIATFERERKAAFK